MNALFYIIWKSAVNSLRELLHKPAKLAVWALVTAVIVGMVFLSFFTKAQVKNPPPLFWFSGILFAFVAIFVVVAVIKGLSSGDTIFEMNDVNLLFVSPVNPRRILLYGIFRMAKTAFLAGFFILFQASSLANFGIDYGGVLLTFAGFILSMIVMSIVSLVIYSVTNGKSRRRLAVKLITALLFIPLAALLAAEYLNTRDIFETLEAGISSPLLRFVPVAGWTASGVTAFLAGKTLTGFLFFGLNVLLGAGLTVYILLSNPDFYEDVLVATETAYEKKRTIAEGNINAAGVSKKAVRITKTGIPGSGAAALFGKHMRESFRENRFGILTLPSVLVAAGAIVVTLFVRDLSIVMQILMWVQIMLIGTGRGLKETYSHYIYMIPESSFKKILWSNIEIMARTLLESLLIFGIGGALVAANPVYILACFLTYTLFSLLLLGVNYMLMRFTGVDVSVGLLIMIYYFAVLLAMAPGLALAIGIGGSIGGNVGFLSGLLILSGWELIAGLGFFALSSGVLHNCDMAMLKTKK